MTKKFSRLATAARHGAPSLKAIMNAPEDMRSLDSGRWRPGWRTKAIAFVIGGIFAVLSFGNPGGYAYWGLILMAGGALAVPVLQFRKLWDQGRFWIIISLLAVIQVPLIVAVQPIIERLKAPYLLVFGISDGVFVILIITLLC